MRFLATFVLLASLIFGAGRLVAQSPTPFGFEPGCGGSMVAGSPASGGPCEGNMLPSQTGKRGSSLVGNSFTGAGDVVSGAKAWWGLRAYNAAYATSNGKLINIVRASDSGTCDVLAATSGGFGVTANCSNGTNNGVTAATFCNATTCTVATFYDQSGALNCTAAVCNATNGTVANQLALSFNCINTSLPCLTGNGSTQSEITPATFTSIAQPLTVVAVYKRTGGFAAQGDLISASNGVVAGPSANIVSQFYGSFPNASATDSAAHIIAAIGNDGGSGSSIWVDGTQTTGTAGTGAFPAATSLGIMSSQAATSFLTGNFYEGGVYAVAFTSTQAGNMCHNQFTYWGTATSC